MVDAPFALGELRLADDVGSADWIVGTVRDFQYDVASLLPPGLGAYARVFHPAGRQLEGGSWGEVSWSQVAAANGRVAHAAMDWVGITGGWCYLHGRTQPGIWDREPSEGSLPVRQAAGLARVLSRFTKTPAAGWFAVWDGSGSPAYPREAAPRLLMPHRPMVLFAGPLSAVTTSFDAAPFDQRAHLWWPQDRSWCVATDTDLMSTYVAGSADCVAAVLAEDELESYAVTADQKVSWDSDTVNQLPPRSC
ncbi:MAG: hypothetical protein M3Z75_30015 [Actinomycetota bacterium]|nr:hypothetical protein [Actinomycetota bacterium]